MADPDGRSGASGSSLSAVLVRRGCHPVVAHSSSRIRPLSALPPVGTGRRWPWWSGLGDRPALAHRQLHDRGVPSRPPSLLDRARRDARTFSW